jgi:hypothetical protein
MPYGACVSESLLAGKAKLDNNNDDNDKKYGEKYNKVYVIKS